MNSIEQLAAQLQKLMSDLNKRKPQAYDTEAEVLRVDKKDPSVVWVKIPGGVDETPVRRTIDAKPGDTVMVRISRGRAWINGNQGSPPTDDTRAIIADENASVAGLAAESAARMASDAQDAANDALVWAEDAHTAAQEAWNYADDANDAANSAIGSARTANYYANNALSELAIVQDVAGVLEWISSNGEYDLATDITVQPNTIYFEYDSVTGIYSPVVDYYTETTDTSPVSGKTYYTYDISTNSYHVWAGTEFEDDVTYYEQLSPVTEGWYILDIYSSQTRYILTHLAVTDRGLWVLPNGLKTGSVTPDQGETEQDARARKGQDYKVLLSSSGMYVYDQYGSSVAFYGSTIRIGIDSSGYSRTLISSNGVQFRRRTATADIILANIGYGDGSDGLQSISQAPYYTFGIRQNPPINEYDPNSTYSYGDTCIYNNEVYICHKDITAPEPFTGSKWQEGIVGNYSLAEGRGVVSAGYCSHAEGEECIAADTNAHAEGYQTIAGSEGHAEGSYSKAIGRYSHAEGFGSKAFGSASHAEGEHSEASGAWSHAEGYGTTASKSEAHAEGGGSKALGAASHAEGSYTRANGDASHAEGYQTFANGNYSHSGGYYASADGEHSFAHGYYVTALRDYQTVVGRWNRGQSDALFIVGNGALDDEGWPADDGESNAFEVTESGDIRLSLANYDVAGDIDKTIYDALVLLSWSDAVVGSSYSKRLDMKILISHILTKLNTI